jgi:hypothetical protein
VRPHAAGMRAGGGAQAACQPVIHHSLGTPVWPASSSLCSCMNHSKRLQALVQHFHPGTMSTEEYDLVTIGAGSGGVRASRLAAGQYGAKVRWGDEVRVCAVRRVRR